MISGDTGSEAGVTVTVTVDGTELTATSAASGAWSVDVPANATYITGTSVTVTVSASKTGFTSPSDVTRTLAVDLTAPSATYTAPSSLQVGVAIGAMTPSTTATDIAEYGATGLPSGLGIDTGTGVISGTPDTADANTASAAVTVKDTAGNTATVSITFPAVAKGDQTLTGFAYSSASVTFGGAAPAVTAPGGVQTTLSYSATPATVCTVDASTGALTLVEVGDCNITATAAGTANYNEATAAFTVTVQAAGALALNLDTIAGDDTVNIADEKAAGFAISGDTGSEAGVTVSVTLGSQSPLTATSGSGGAWSVDVPADAAYLTGTSVAVTVSAAKTGFTAPSDVTRTLAVDLTAPSATYTAPSALQVGVAIGAMTPTTTATDIAEYGATGLPSGLGIDTGTGVISGTPDTADANTASAAVTVKDTAGNPATVSITFPAVAKGNQTLTGFAYSSASVTFGGAAPAVTAPGGVQTTLSYSATPATVCTVDASTGALTLVEVGDCNITATAAGTANYNEATAAFTVTVAAAGALALNLDTIAGDDTVNIAEKAAGFAISGDTGSEAGVTVSVTLGSQSPLTATSGSGGAWSVDVPADAAYLTGTSVAVTVSASKTGFTAPSDVTRTLAVDLAVPTASYTAPGTLQVGVAIGAMTPSTTATDIAEYGATGLPSGLGIDTGTGVISGTPDTADANTASAAVTVKDTAGNPATVSITFPAVAKGDQTLTGFAYSSASVTFGGAAPAVTAPGGVQTTLSYSATPATVCTVDASTGALTLVEVGDCNITATAAGTANYNEATAAFTVTVQAAGALALNLDTIAGDDTVNIAEKAAGFAISGDTGSEAGVTVSVTLGSQSPLTATSGSGGAWSVDVPADADYLTGTSVAVTVSASKTGFTAPSDVTRTLAVDLTAPSATYTAPSALQVGVAVSAMTPTTTDTDIAEYGATGLPPGLGIDAGTGVVSGTPDTADANTAAATVTVTDIAGNPATVSIAFPAVAKGNQTLTGFAYSSAMVTYGDTAPTVTAPSGVQTTLSYSATPSDVCTVDSSTGALTLAGAGECEVTATAAPSGDYNRGTASYTVTVLVSIQGICNRTVRVRDRILELLKYRHSFKGGCGDVNETHLAQLESLDLGRNPSTESAFTISLQSDDFKGLVNLERLFMRDTRLSSLPAGVFSGLAALDTLELNKNRLSSLPAGVFSDLHSLKTLLLQKNPRLSSLPYDEFEALPNLTELRVDPEGRRGYQVAGGEGDVTLEVAAGDRTTYQVRLTHRPAYVNPPHPTLTVSSDTVGVVATPATLRFTRENWFRRQTVTVDAPASAAGETATLKHTSTGVTYDRPIPTVTVRVLESGNSRSADPLTAEFQGLPSSHDGETAFSFRLAFSEAVAVTPEAMRTRALTVAGGAVTGAARVDGESGVWEITVTPDSREDLSITLAPTEDCEADGAVCTSDGRTLSAVPAHIVPGPGPETEPALTASFEGLPEVHDGEEGFHFRVAFSRTSGSASGRCATIRSRWTGAR